MKSVLILLPFTFTGVIVYVIYSSCFTNPVFVEYYYSRGVYPVLSKFSILTANLPFSAAEILLYSFLAFLILYLIFIAASFFRQKKLRMQSALFRTVVLFVILSSMWGSFMLGWSINYARQPLSQSLGLDASPSSGHELYNLCNHLAQKANYLRSQTEQDENGVFKLTKSKEQINTEVKTVYRNNAPTFMNLGGETNVKGVFSANLLSIMNTLGIYIPFTYEPNINMQMPDLYFASSALHEYAHFKGFAREDEANFIAYYISKDMTDTDFSYSSTMLALCNALNQLADLDCDLYYTLYDSLSDPVKRDFSNEGTYWAAFEETKETVETMNNNYLISNKQTDGVQSYGRMVDLLIALNRSGDL